MRNLVNSELTQVNGGVLNVWSFLGTAGLGGVGGGIVGGVWGYAAGYYHPYHSNVFALQCAEIGVVLGFLSGAALGGVYASFKGYFTE